MQEDGTQHDAQQQFWLPQKLWFLRKYMGRILQMLRLKKAKIDKGGLIAVIDSIQLQLQKRTELTKYGSIEIKTK